MLAAGWFIVFIATARHASSGSWRCRLGRGRRLFPGIYQGDIELPGGLTGEVSEGDPGTNFQLPNPL